MPVDTFVVLMMENRSFDHYLGWLPNADGRQAGLSYVDAHGVRHATHPLAPDFQGCGHAIPGHLWNEARVQFAGGRCDGSSPAAAATMRTRSATTASTTFRSRRTWCGSSHTPIDGSSRHRPRRKAGCFHQPRVGATDPQVATAPRSGGGDRPRRLHRLLPLQEHEALRGQPQTPVEPQLAAHPNSASLFDDALGPQLIVNLRHQVTSGPLMGAQHTHHPISRVVLPPQASPPSEGLIDQWSFVTLPVVALTAMYLVGWTNPKM